MYTSHSTLTQNENFTYLVFKSIYFDYKLSFRVNLFGHGIFNALSMSLKKILDKKHKLHHFYE